MRKFPRGGYSGVGVICNGGWPLYYRCLGKSVLGKSNSFCIFKPLVKFSKKIFCLQSSRVYVPMPYETICSYERNKLLFF